MKRNRVDFGSNSPVTWDIVSDIELHDDGVVAGNCHICLSADRKPVIAFHSPHLTSVEESEDSVRMTVASQITANDLLANDEFQNIVVEQHALCHRIGLPIPTFSRRAVTLLLKFELEHSMILNDGFSTFVVTIKRRLGKATLLDVSADWGRAQLPSDYIDAEPEHLGRGRHFFRFVAQTSALDLYVEIAALTFGLEPEQLLEECRLAQNWFAGKIARHPSAIAYQVGGDQ